MLNIDPTQQVTDDLKKVLLGRADPEQPVEIALRSKQTACAGLPVHLIPSRDSALGVQTCAVTSWPYLQLSSPSEKRRFCALPRLPCLYVRIILH